MIAKMRQIVLTLIEIAYVVLSFDFTNSLIPRRIIAIPIVISIPIIEMRAVFKEIVPQHTPLANGIKKQNLGSYRFYVASSS
jgi:hypothetical protein